MSLLHKFHDNLSGGCYLLTLNKLRLRESMTLAKVTSWEVAESGLGSQGPNIIDVLPFRYKMSSENRKGSDYPLQYK